MKFPLYFQIRDLQKFTNLMFFNSYTNFFVSQLNNNFQNLDEWIHRLNS